MLLRSCSRSTDWLAAGEVQHDWAMYHIRMAGGRGLHGCLSTYDASRLLQGVCVAALVLLAWYPAIPPCHPCMSFLLLLCLATAIPAASQRNVAERQAALLEAGEHALLVSTV